MRRAVKDAQIQDKQQSRKENKAGPDQNHNEASRREAACLLLGSSECWRLEIALVFGADFPARLSREARCGKVIAGDPASTYNQSLAAWRV